MSDPWTNDPATNDGAADGVALGRPREPFPQRIRIISWNDRKLDQRGHDPRSEYVELFWLGVLGPSATWLARRVADRLEAEPDGFEVDCADLAAELGLNVNKGHASTFARAVTRCVMFGVARPLVQTAAHHRPGWRFRRHLPTVAARHLARLPDRVQVLHGDWYRHHVVGEHALTSSAGR